MNARVGGYGAVALHPRSGLQRASKGWPAARANAGGKHEVGDFLHDGGGIVGCTDQSAAGEESAQLGPLPGI